MKPYAEVLSEFAESVEYNNIPKNVVEKAKDHIIDTIGICFAASKNRNLQNLVKVVKQLGGSPESTIIRFGDKISSPNAALANGSMAHALDYDDTHLEAVTHLSATIVPTILAVGEKIGLSGKQVLATTIVGYEVATRIGNAASESFHKKGFHPTSLFGTFATTVITGKILGLDSKQIADAMGICGSFASGIFEFLADGSWVKPIHAGWSAHAGIIAALMAKQGLAGPHTILEGRFGLYNTHVGLENVKLDKVIEGLGKKWETLNISIKPYPSCHFTHSSMDTALLIKRKYNLDPKEISNILCLVPKTPFHIVCEPADEKINPKTDYDAKFSLPFTVATVLLKDTAGLDAFTNKTIKDPEILSLARKVKCEIDPKSPFPGIPYVPGWVKITTNNGKIFEEKMEYNRGSPQNPLTKEDISSKFYSNTKGVISKTQSDKIINIIRKMDQIKDIGELLSLCTVN